MMHVFTVDFDKCNVSLLYKIDLFKKKVMTPK